MFSPASKKTAKRTHKRIKIKDNYLAKKKTCFEIEGKLLRKMS